MIYDALKLKCDALKTRLINDGIASPAVEIFDYGQEIGVCSYGDNPKDYGRFPSSASLDEILSVVAKKN